MGAIQKDKAMKLQEPLPQYQSHKKVRALKIALIEDPTQPDEDSNGSRLIIPEEEGYLPFIVDHEYMKKHRPEVGGYFVEYEDGYVSYSPAEPFESGYTKI